MTSALQTVPSTERRTNLAHRALSFAASVLLVSAAMLKFSQLMTAPKPVETWLDMRGTQLMLINAEIALAIWILSGWRINNAHLITTIAFAVFGCYAILLAVTGHKTCGCFGAVPTNPWLTGVFDLIFAALLLAFPPVRKQLSNRRVRTGIAGCLCVVVTTLVTIAEITGRDVQTIGASDVMLLDPSRHLVVLEPETWTTKTFPLAEYTDLGSQLMKGEWIVLFYHEECSECQRAIPLYEKAARTAEDRSEKTRFAFISLSAAEKFSGEYPASSGNLIRGRLSTSHEWFATTPLALKISEGIVISYASGDSAITPEGLTRR